jgi:hypothetical protein
MQEHPRRIGNVRREVDDNIVARDRSGYGT